MSFLIVIIQVPKKDEQRSRILNVQANSLLLLLHLLNRSTVPGCDGASVFVPVASDDPDVRLCQG